jgi:hypothetical protein
MHPGSFVPDIQQFVSGLESVTKRLVVIAFEDSYVEPKRLTDLVHLLACALAAQRFRSWRPTAEQIVRWMQIALQLHAERRAYNYSTTTTTSAAAASSKKSKAPSAPEAAPSAQAAEQQWGAGSLGQCCALLAALGSLSGDHRMVADIARNRGAKIEADRKHIEGVMPWEHLIDQHCAPAVAYYFNAEAVEAADCKSAIASRPFAALFGKLFQGVTGLNPRRHDVAAAQRVSFRQSLSLSLSLSLR